ncbi:MAG: hypothetical protein V3U40_00970 [Candidatus Scalindua sediminis]
MIIKFDTEEEFQRLLSSLAQEIVDANIHWRLLSDLKGNIELFSKEYNESAAFWTLTFQAHLDATIFHLIRIYDGNSASLSLKNLLDTISANLRIFETERFRERLKNNPFVESLSEDSRKPDEQQLYKDIEFASNNNPIVNKLTIWRNNLFAHKSAGNTVKGYNIASDYPLYDKEIEELLVGGKTILNRYSNLFHANTYSTQIVGHDDYQFVLKSIRFHLEKMDQEVKAQILAYKQRQANKP